MHRCFVENKIDKNSKVKISGDEAKHISKVLRLSVSDEIEICDFSGYVFVGKITNITKDVVECDVINSYIQLSEPKTKVYLFQGLSKGTKMDLVIQKAVELGVYQVIPVEMEFSVVKVDREDAKQDRWQRIAFEAAKQCKRTLVPEIMPVVNFKTAVKMLQECDLALTAYEKENVVSVKEILNDKSFESCGFIIGPEGGFSPKEIKLIEDTDIKTISLGNRILRTETAAIALLTIIMYHSGELGLNS